MLEMFKKTVYAAIGLALMTQDKVEEFGKRVADEAKLGETEGRRFIDELLKKSEETRRQIEQMINEKVEIALKKFNVPTRSEIESIENRLRILEVKSGKTGT